MSKLSKKQKKNQIHSNANRIIECKQDISFSFQYLTTNNNYNLKKCDNKIKSALLERLEDLSKHDIKYWFNQNKRVGFETIPSEEVKFKPNGYNDLTKEVKFIIARFGSGDYRIIFMKIGNCPILHIIGLDLHYKAYNHGS